MAISKNKQQAASSGERKQNAKNFLSNLSINQQHLLFDIGSLYTRVAVVDASTGVRAAIGQKYSGTRFPKKNSMGDRSDNLSKLLEGSRLLFNQPSCYLLEKETQSILTIGKHSFGILGKEPDNTSVVFPVRKGVVYHKRWFQQYLLALIEQLKEDISWGWLTKVSATCFVPQLATNLDRQIIKDSFDGVGFGRVEVKDKAEAILRSVPGFDSSGVSDDSLPKGLITVLDIGDQLTEVALGSWGKVSFSRTLNFGGHILTRAIIDHLRSHHDLHVSQLQAMKVKHQLPSLELFMKVSDNSQSRSISTQLLNIRGVDLSQGLVVTKNIQAQSIGLAVVEKLPALTKQLKRVFSQMQSEHLLAALENGLLLLGGGSLMMGLDHYLSQEMKLNVSVVNKPLVNLGSSI